MKLLLVDDHIVVREGVKRLLAAFLDMQVLEAGRAKEAIALLRAERPAMVILDLNLPGSGGLVLLQRILAEEPPPRVLVFSVHTTPLYVSRALQAGAGGYISKSAPAEELVEAIRVVSRGGRYVERELANELVLNLFGDQVTDRSLSNRDIEILRLLAAGQSPSEMAEHLGLSYKTVANLLTRIKQKLLVTRTSDLIKIALESYAG